MKTIHAFGLEWHVSGRSTAFHKLLLEPLRSYARLTFQTSKPFPGAETLIFCQVIPPADLPRYDNVIWIPMWDAVRTFSQTWWEALPKALRIVAFSEQVAACAERAGLRCLRLKYYENPANYPPVGWDDRVLYYWNRQGLVSPQLLVRLCEALRVDRLIFREQIDPGIDQRAYYHLPAYVGRTRVETLDPSLPFDEYQCITAQANIVIAPRLFEGVGLVVLEGLARGCMVFANPAPTMNEYITHGETGFFVKRGWSAQRVKVAILSRIAPYHAPFAFHLPERQDWKAIAALDVEQVGAAARADHAEGYRQWQAMLPMYARFILKD